MTVDVPMYLNRWRADVTGGSKRLRPLEGLRDVSTRWVVTHDIAEWKGEIAWMSLYFSAAVWASLALCVCYSLEDHLPRYRTEAAVAGLVLEYAGRHSQAAAGAGGPQLLVLVTEFVSSGISCPDKSGPNFAHSTLASTARRLMPWLR